MSTDLADRLESMVMAGIPIDGTPSEGELRSLIEAVGKALGAAEDVRIAVLNRVMERQRIRMDTGTRLVSDHKPWLAARRASIEPFFWDRYLKYLERDRWPRPVLLGLDKSTDEVLDLFGNPVMEGDWRRRGLVIGDVQSGKTATYTALACKAADAGYGLIVLLTGTLENLRRQTQERLDAGFVGFDSSGELQRTRLGKQVGVGLIDQRRQATVFTSRTKDFNRQTVQALGLTLSSLKGPALVVVKKNVSILRNLKEWLSDLNAEHDGTIDVPVLLIDDEADNASINTNSEDTDPTAINEGIRSILSLFRKSTYVGVTATPFANIFIDPETQDDMLGDDLFPSDFIYALEPPTNYFGPSELFLKDEAEEAFLREIDDSSELLPLKHKKDFTVDELPETLQESIAAFLVGNAIRDLRGEGPTHRSMLINVSRFTSVQNAVEQRVLDELTKIKNDVRNFSKLSESEARRSSRIDRLHEVWSREFADCGVSWAQVQGALLGSVLPIETRAVNQSTGAASLDFRKYQESGLRVIAVGGNSLSRGLTLEGLFVSYFHRNSQMYDTLLQMGRWFGYRDGYRDLCRVWLTREAIDWYAHISEASRELKDEIKRMRAADLTPRDFGLEVRAHPDSLIVTARNKMRTAKDIERVISVSAQAFESVEIPAAARDENWRVADDFVARLKRGTPKLEASRLGNPIFYRVPALDVARFVSSFVGSESDILFQPRQLAEFIRKAEVPQLTEWDVVIPQGKAGTLRMLGGLHVAPQIRRVDERGGNYVVSGNKRRIGSRGIESEGIDSVVVESIKNSGGDSQISDKAFRLRRERPLLLVHVLEIRRVVRKDSIGKPIFEWVLGENETPVVGIGLSFPDFGDQGAQRVRYRANLVKYRELFSAEADEGEDDEDAA